MISWVILAWACVWAAVSQPEGYFSFGALLLRWLLTWALWRWIRLEITETTVRVRLSYFRRNRPIQVGRSRIRAIHYDPFRISFCGPNGSLLMWTKADWSLKQMIAVAAELQVPIYDNRRCLNLLPKRVGRLVYNPFDDRRLREGVRRG
ncbi:hypothetical protein GCM10023322_68720 [Rugosimonospora acidiphila]|uniref:Uncharacterized protein n=1 Tax=Rugosimonospora acidiphila TaxID=556531 RepID=A0ABP9SJC8_9ACTN